MPGRGRAGSLARREFRYLLCSRYQFLMAAPAPGPGDLDKDGDECYAYGAGRDRDPAADKQRKVSEL